MSDLVRSKEIFRDVFHLAVGLDNFVVSGSFWEQVLLCDFINFHYKVLVPALICNSVLENEEEVVVLIINVALIHNLVSDNVGLVSVVLPF